MIKKILFMFIIIILSTSLIGCNQTSEEDKKLAKKIVKDYSKAFKKQAKVQYGEKARVEDIYAETYTIGGQFLDVYYQPTGRLTGTIFIGDEKLDASYSPGRESGNNGIISTKKNYQKILDSIEDYYKDLNLKILDSSLLNHYNGTDYFKDNTLTFKDFLETSDTYNSKLYIYTLDDLEKIDVKKLEKLTESVENSERTNIEVIIMQMKDTLFLEELKKDSYTIKFWHEVPVGYGKRDESGDLLTVFARYNIEKFISYTIIKDGISDFRLVKENVDIQSDE